VYPPTACAGREADFWLAQRAAVADDPSVGYAVTTDIQRALHPPDKQDVADRLTLELLRLVYADSHPGVVARGPELLRATPDAARGTVALEFSNATLAVHAGILVGSNAACAGMAGNSSMAVEAGTARSLAYAIAGGVVTVECPAGVSSVHINADAATCFLYGPTGLPAPPVIARCKTEK
jgi:hypothetical protein